MTNNYKKAVQELRCLVETGAMDCEAAINFVADRFVLGVNELGTLMDLARKRYGGTNNE